MLDSYMWVAAGRSFHEAIRADSQCAAAWLGLSEAQFAVNRREEAARALARAAELVGDEEPTRTLIRLRSLEVAAIETPGGAGGDSRRMVEQYRTAIRTALADRRDDAELWILLGRSLEASPGGIGQNGGEDSREAYETALRHAPRHPAAHHYLAHALENLGRYSEAAEHAKSFAAEAPRVPHAEHMLGHVLPRLGRWDEALEHLERSDRLGRELARTQRFAPGEDWHLSHNLQLLGLVQLRVGRTQAAERTLRRMFEEPIALESFAWRRVVYPELLVEQGRFEDAVAAARRLGEAPDAMSRAAAAAIEGEARLAQGRVEEARGAAAKGAAILAEAGGNPSEAAHSAESYVQQLQAEIGLRGPSAEAAERAMRIYARSVAGMRRFDAWGEADLRLSRLSAQARRAGKPELADEIATIRSSTSKPGSRSPTPVSSPGGSPR